MRTFLGLLSAAAAQLCPNLRINLNVEKAKVFNKCTRAEDSKCDIKCAWPYELRVRDDSQKLQATCSCTDSQSCKWTYGVNGAGNHNEIPTYTCCDGPLQKQVAPHTLGLPYIEADSTTALVVYKIKNKKSKETITNGYSILVTFEPALPDDFEISTFANMEVSNRYTSSSKTYVMFKSKPGKDRLEKNVLLFLSFVITVRNVDNFTTAVDSFLQESAKPVLGLYKDRHDCHCVGNDDFCKGPAETKFASFNIQTFGVTKYGKEPVKNKIVTILRRYDISTIQEIRELAGVSFPALVADMNAEEDIYEFHVGARQGSTSSKEQYGFIWNRNMFNKIDAYDYDDTMGVFERPPGVVVLERVGADAHKFDTSKVIIISIHTKPVTGSTNMDTENEINKLADVYNDAVLKHPDVKNAIIAGDFNGDCNYVQDPENLSLFTDPRSTFLIGFDEDTTTKTTDCAYDHIVVYGDTLPPTSGNAGRFDFQTFYGTDNIFYDGKPITELISDHFPVEFTFT